MKVRDDNKIIEAYRIPILDYSVQMTEEERRTIRENLIQEQLEKITENIIKPGYQKYLYRKSKKNTEINQEDFTEDEEYEVTEKKVRIMKLDRKRHYQEEINMQNNTDTDKIVYVEIEGVEVRIE